MAEKNEDGVYSVLKMAFFVFLLYIWLDNSANSIKKLELEKLELLIAITKLESKMELNNAKIKNPSGVSAAFLKFEESNSLLLLARKELEEKNYKKGLGYVRQAEEKNQEIYMKSLLITD